MPRQSGGGIARRPGLLRRGGFVAEDSPRPIFNYAPHHASRAHWGQRGVSSYRHTSPVLSKDGNRGTEELVRPTFLAFQKRACPADYISRLLVSTNIDPAWHVFERVRSLDPEFVKLVVPLLPPEKSGDAPLDIQTARRFMATQKKGKDHALQTLYPHLLETVSIQDIQIPMRDGHVNDLKVYKPTDLKPSESLPVFFSNHGGGFVVGNTETEDLINRQLTHECRLVIFSLDYRLSPEHPTIPTIFNDAEDGLKWVYEHAPEYDGDMTKGLLTGGTSVGGLMASMLAFRSAKLGIPVTGTLMRQGAVMMPFVAKEEWKPRLKSMEENADAPLFNTKIAVDMYKLMTFPEGSLTDPWNFPVFASEEELARHPPIFITGAGCDPIIDDLYLFKDLLEKAGVPVQLKVHEGVPHGFHGFHMLKAAKEEMQDTPAGVKWLLGFSRGAVA